MISIIIPAYNAEKTIGRALATASAQTYKDIEIIVVDDGSTDKTYDVVEEFHKKDKRVIPYSYPRNKGVSYARNKGIELAEGDLIYFLDADDYMAPEALQILYDGYTRSKLPMVVGGAVREPSHHYHMPAYIPYFPGTEDAILDRREIFDAVCVYINTNRVYFISHCWGRLYEREFVGDVRFNETVELGEDGIFNLRLFGKHRGYRGAMIINKPLYHFQQHSSSSNKAFNSISVEHDLIALHDELVHFFIRMNPHYDYLEEVRSHIASLFISQLIRATGTTVSEVRSLLSSHFLQKMLACYSPKPGQSKIIPMLMKLQLARLTLYFCKRRAR